MQSSRFSPYSWYLDEDETECTCIRIYGLNEQNENVCVRVDDFYPYSRWRLTTGAEPKHFLGKLLFKIF